MVGSLRFLRLFELCGANLGLWFIGRRGFYECGCVSPLLCRGSLRKGEQYVVLYRTKQSATFDADSLSTVASLGDSSLQKGSLYRVPLADLLSPKSGTPPNFNPPRSGIQSNEDFQRKSSIIPNSEFRIPNFEFPLLLLPKL